MSSRVKKAEWDDWLIFQAWADARPSLRVFLSRLIITLFALTVTFLIRMVTKILVDDWTGEALVLVESVAMLVEFGAFCAFSFLDLITLLLESSMRPGR